MKNETKLVKQEDKDQVIGIYQPLLSNTFGGTNYTKYYLDDAKGLVASHVDAELKRRNLSTDALRKCQEIRKHVSRAKNINRVLELLTEACLLDDELIF
ncbi:MAG: hypothetical protein LC687_04875 [Actinobacteria bacterium]|nr:hypothetical protein [Actinomycetota bacterium]MCA1807167.1 hypothetical protein [Actinomycetota bacterium]